MADPRFFSVSSPIPLSQLAEAANAELIGASPDQLMHDVGALSLAGPDHISFLDNKKYVSQFAKSAAGACVVDPEMVDKAPGGMALLVTDAPYLGYARIGQLFYPEARQHPEASSEAPIADSALIGEDVIIGAGAVILERAEIGDRCHIGANAVIGTGCVVGADSNIGSNVSLSHSIIGQHVTIFPGASIGQDGFGFAISSTGAVKVPQLGRVMIEDNVEIGANTTIDRGAGPDTVIGAGTMIDNLVQIGHNVEIGKNCVVVSQVGISGSTVVGNGVMIGGQTGFAGHLQIGDGAQVAARSGVTKNVQPGNVVAGFPARPMRQWLRELAFVERLVKKR
ncbi:MAG: UDP-3-O-(3-hydroxymyristoyl)glucosamine N-acyltransferase [Rhodospirillaceae bacterium]|nr:UDP-3-O-(3-hydroxymyristoyl)glucosamine N-acyltransferase [Rhodospirillaceae bacterium]